MKYYTFPTLSEAEAACPIILQADFDARCSGSTCLIHPADPETGEPTCFCSCESYTQQTKCCGMPRQRTSNADYVVPWNKYTGDMNYTVVDIDTATEWPT